MLLIISENNDPSTDDVIDYLSYLKTLSLRINNNSTTQLTLLENDDICDFTLEYEGNKVKLSAIESYWYRRTDLMYNNKTLWGNLSQNSVQDRLLRQNIFQQVSEEWRGVNEYFANLLKQKNGLGSVLERKTSKLWHQYLAKQIGFKIPATLVTSLKKDLIKFKETYPELITKRIQNTLHFQVEGHYFGLLTQPVTPELIDELPKKFFPTMFQERVEKLYELRVFYLAGECYAMAIFSQLDEQTKLDFRHYNDEKPNRFVPYNLTSKEKLQIDQFMKLNNLDTGSLDFMVDRDKNMVFLEVNPEGQLGMVSIPCNYYLEEKIAKFLINKDG